MCGRYFFRMKEDASFSFLRKLQKQQQPLHYTENEIFPTNQALVLIFDKGAYRLDVMHWGIRNNQNKRLYINGRSETIQKKKIVSSMGVHPCLLPCNGFFEWRSVGRFKEKVYIEREDTPLFYLAGMYNEDKMFMIITGEASDQMRRIHSRMPIIVTPKQVEMRIKWWETYSVDARHLRFHDVGKEKTNTYRQISLFDEDPS